MNLYKSNVGFSEVSQDPFICTLEQCLTCGLQFLSKKLLRSHRKSKHPTETTDTFTCYLCGKTYRYVVSSVM